MKQELCAPLAIKTQAITTNIVQRRSQRYLSLNTVSSMTHYCVYKTQKSTLCVGISSWTTHKVRKGEAESTKPIRAVWEMTEYKHDGPNCKAGKNRQ